MHGSIVSPLPKRPFQAEPPGRLCPGRFPPFPPDLLLRRAGAAGRTMPGPAGRGRAQPVLRLARVRVRRSPRRAVPALESVRVPRNAVRRQPAVGDVLSDELALRRAAAVPRDQPGDHPQPVSLGPVHVSLGAAVRAEVDRRDRRRGDVRLRRAADSSASSRGTGASSRRCRGFRASCSAWRCSSAADFSRSRSRSARRPWRWSGSAGIRNTPSTAGSPPCCTWPGGCGSGANSACAARRASSAASR